MHVHGALLSRFALKERGHGGRRPDEQGGSSFLVGPKTCEVTGVHDA